MTSVAHQGDSLTGRQRLVYILILGSLAALGPFTIDLYLPAFPALTEDFGVSDAAIQLTLTGTTIGFGCGMLFMGPWSDKVGRRMPLIIATTVHVVSSVACSASVSVVMLGIFRVTQGMGAAAGGVVAMAMVRDLFGASLSCGCWRDSRWCRASRRSSLPCWGRSCCCGCRGGGCSGSSPFTV